MVTSSDTPPQSPAASPPEAQAAAEVPVAKVSSLRFAALADMMDSDGLFLGKDDENAWQFTYMDMITLMFSIFVLLLAMYGKQTSERLELVEGMNSRSYDQAIKLAEDAASPQQEAWDAISERIEAQGLGDQVSLQSIKGGLVMTMKETLLFPSGSADLSQQGGGWIREIAELIHSDVALISVEGHTDNIPIATDKFPSNWELSAGRASGVVREMVAAGIAPDKLRAIGYAETRPIGENTSPDGRTRNRRVQIKLNYTEVED